MEPDTVLAQQHHELPLLQLRALVPVCSPMVIVQLTQAFPSAGVVSVDVTRESVFVCLMATISGAVEPSRSRTEWDGLLCFVWIVFFNPYSFIYFAPPGLSYSMWDLVP